MSWQEQINQQFIIVCGDGNRYTPLWPASSVTKEVEFNITEFNFPGTDGTFVDRRRPKGAKYAMDIVFQGLDHLDTARSFETSAKDTRPWVVEHPLYGRLTVQPVSLTFDNTTLNNSRVTGTLIETIEQSSLVLSDDPPDFIQGLKNDVDTTGQPTFTYVFETPDDSLRATYSELYFSGENSGAPQFQQEEYANLFNQANAAILNATNDPLAALRSIQQLLGYPAYLEISVKNRLDIFKQQLDQLFAGVGKINNPEGKPLFEFNAGSVISSMCVATALPLSTDYVNVAQVVDVINELIIVENTFIGVLDSIQTPNGGDTDSYVPDYPFINSVITIIDYTISNLFNIALGARQERRIFLEYDSNLIVQAHRFYGLGLTDEELELFRTSNNIGLSEILLLRHGRELVYYIQ